MSHSQAGIDLDALTADLDALRDRLRAGAGPADAAHLRKMIRWNRLCFILGYGTAWIAPNPISALLISTGIFTRWALIAHHVMHKGYNRIEGLPAHLHARSFARGWRRWIDWPDWIHPETWRHEHNILHHYKLGETADPDQPEHNMAFLRTAGLPRPLRALVLLLTAMAWKTYYYPSNSEEFMYARRMEKAGRPSERTGLTHPSKWSPMHPVGRAVWWRSWLPYALYRFGALPLPFLALGTSAWLAVVINSALAEICTNVHGFLTIVPNHAGDDLYRFDGPLVDRRDFYLRQIVGSTDYRCGGDLNDFVHGWLNYQIEHHLWPDMTPLQYRKAHPQVKAICARHGVPFVQASVWCRTVKLLRILAGDASMRWWAPSEFEAGLKPPAPQSADAATAAP